MTIKIAVVGPESTGKTSLASALARHYHCPWVKEYAVQFLNNLKRPYVREDLIDIAKGQVAWEESELKNKPQMIICDTNLLVVKVWNDFKYKVPYPEIDEMTSERIYDLHLLNKPDLPWEPADFRENEHELDELFDFYKDALDKSRQVYHIVEGIGRNRIMSAIQAIDLVLSK